VYKKFQELSEIQQETYPLIVYRGQILNANDLKRLESNVDPFILMNTFMSTTRNEEIARLFIRGARLSALFKINIHNRFRSYIDISSFSSMPYEQEILFFPGTIFSIDSIQQENDSTWIIELTLNNEISEHIENLISDFQNHIPVFKNKHNVFMKTDDFRLIKQYYNVLTGEEFCLNNESLNMIYIYVAFMFIIHMIIGYLYYNFSVYDNAFLHYGIVLSLLDEGNLLTLELYNHIGDVWNTIDNIDYAVSCYQQALNVGSINNICRSDINQKLNDLLLKKKHSAPNSIYQRQINDIDEHYRSIINPDNETELKDCQCQLKNEHNLTPIQHIDALYRFGICLMRKGDFCYALEIFLKTKQMVIDQPPDDENNSTSIWFIDLSYQIGLCWMKKGDFDQALKNLLTAEQIIIKNPPLWDRFPQLLATLYDNITILYFFLNEP
ncbi:unnamed protein product, partial [Adineta steineri]